MRRAPKPDVLVLHRGVGLFIGGVVATKRWGALTTVAKWEMMAAVKEALHTERTFMKHKKVLVEKTGELK